MAHQQQHDRRRFLGTLGRTSLASMLANSHWQATGGAAWGDEADEQSVQPPPDLPKDLSTTGSDIGSLFPQIQQLAEKDEYSHSFLSGRFASLEEFHTAGRDVVLSAFGYRPEPVAPQPEIVDRQDLGYCIREKLVFSTSPSFRVPAYLHIPKGLKDPAPAVVDLHSHGGMYLFGKEKVMDLGNNHPVMQEYHRRNYGGRPTATALVRRGYVVITIDALYFGERRLLLDEDLRFGWDRSKYSVEDAHYLNRKCREKESTLAKSLTLAGITWPGIVTWDDIRTVDYLASRPEVDPQRIGCVGVSMGGHRSLFLAGLDERIKAACVTGFMSTVQPMIRRHIDTHSWVHFIPSLHQRLDLPDVASMSAPRPLLVQQCEQDALFPLEGMKDAVAKVAAVYEKAGVPERFAGRFYPAPHRFDVAMQEEAFDWLDRHLK